MQAMLGSRWHWLSLFTTSMVLVASCYPDRSTDVSDFDTVTTIYDKAAPFGTYKTYALPDSVVHLDTAGQTDNVSHANDGLVLNSVQQNMNTLGFTQVSNAATADLVLLVNATSSTTVGVVSYPYWNYWGWWPGWSGAYGPTYSYYYPTYAVPYSYTTGTVFVSMLDNKNRDTVNKKLPIVWLGGANGLLNGTSSVASRIPTRINQMFTASPFLTPK